MKYIPHIKTNIPEIDKIVIYKPIFLSDLRSKVNLLLSQKIQISNNVLNKNF